MTSGTRGAPEGSARRARALPPGLIALCGALVAGLCLLLLLGPFYPEHARPADHLQRWLMMLLDGRGPFALQRLLSFQFPLLLILLFGTVLVLAPWRRAVHLRRERLGTDQATEKPSAREQRTPARGARRGTSAATAGGGVPAERRSAILAQEDTKTFLSQLRGMKGQSRAITGAELTIPVVFLDLIAENMFRYSKLLNRVRVRNVSGQAR